MIDYLLNIKPWNDYKNKKQKIEKINEIATELIKKYKINIKLK